MEKIGSVSSPIIGKKYLVPTVNIVGDTLLSYSDLIDSGVVDRVYDKRYADFVPVIGNLHEDSLLEFGSDLHIHYDFRFLQESVYRNLVKECKHVKNNETESYAKINRNTDLLGRYVLYIKLANRKADGTGKVKVIFREMTCLRKPINMPLNQVGFMLDTLQEAFCNKTINPQNPVCPHRKAPLKGSRIENGCYVCPCHGLRWDKKTGKMVKMSIPDYAKQG